MPDQPIPAEVAEVADVADGGDGGDNAAELLIRAARARSNAAIAAHDLGAIAREWMADVMVVSASGRSAGGAQAGDFLARQFALRPDTVYVRTPRKVQVFAPWGVASEEGDWVGTWTEPDGALRIGGTYQAQWRCIEGRWLIQGELFVPTHCAGSAYCARHP
jgi:ketosteroid isomerase-like protein